MSSTPHTLAGVHARVCCLDFPLSPESTFPAALAASLAAGGLLVQLQQKAAEGGDEGEGGRKAAGPILLSEWLIKIIV